MTYNKNSSSNKYPHPLFIILVIPIPIEGFVCENNAYCITTLIVENTTRDALSERLVFSKDRTLFPEHLKTVNLTKVTSAEGWNTRRLITVNGTMPGPTIFLYQNQTITIIVKNNLINEGVTIHWHGIDQLGWAAMDGVAFVTQCPILPGQFFNYTFQPRFSGTYWYHSYMGNQRDMALYGVLIVLKRDNNIPIEQQHIIQLMKWNHLYDPSTMLQANTKERDKESISILINGKGEFINNMTQYENFSVDKGDNHVFRLIGIGSDETFLFSVPGLRLIVKETDGYQIVETTVDRIIIYPAERYDFQLDLRNASEGTYNITVHLLQGKAPQILDTPVGLGYIHVSNRHSLPNYTLNKQYEVILNCPFKAYPLHPDFICLPVSELKSRNPGTGYEFDSSLMGRTGELYTHFFGFPEYSTINGRKFILPTANSQLSGLDTTCSGCNEETSCECSLSFNLRPGSVNIMILFNLGTGLSRTHTVHMHGHAFEVLKIGFPTFSLDGKDLIPNKDIQCSESKSNNESQCDRVRWRDPSWNNYKSIPGINWFHPIRKDTIIAPEGGYTIIRIRATNPGVWFMHFYMDPHMMKEVVLILNESFKYLRKGLPGRLTTCHSFISKDAPKGSLLPDDIITILLLGAIMGVLFCAISTTCPRKKIHELEPFL
ncbi:uncharacterized protein LOC133204601 [Saccostrea echinata]|uniref:uncharacterized protein LOC133204601 n=1 Tax=Saccostrea echinata TaxID=191078 RepID=UPI002A82E455|nr:uncharacterized protein LOC133204601 [Saccostrea echinata]